MSTGEFDGLAAVVTGGGSGIGLAVATTLTERGASVACLDLDPPDAAVNILGFECDVTDENQVIDAVRRAAVELDGIDILVNNAGIGAQGTVEANSSSEWHHVFDVNVLGVVHTTRASLPYLRRSSAAAIVNTCSIAATAGLPNRALYSATKGALRSLTLAMAADHLADGIRVNCVHPGTVDTPWVRRLLSVADDPDAESRALCARQPNGRLVSASEVAAAVAYLASPLAGASTGTELAVDGGMHGLRAR